jgi:hypothetical protein
MGGTWSSRGEDRNLFLSLFGNLTENSTTKIGTDIKMHRLIEKKIRHNMEDMNWLTELRIFMAVFSLIIFLEENKSVYKISMLSVCVSNLSNFN